MPLSAFRRTHLTVLHCTERFSRPNSRFLILGGKKYHEWMSDVELRELTVGEPLTLQEEYDTQRISQVPLGDLIFTQTWQKYADKLTSISGDGLLSLGAIFTRSIFLLRIQRSQLVGDVNMFKKGDHLSTASEDLQRAFLTQISLASAPLKN